MRIRTIKPEFWDSASMGRISREARLLFIGMWSLADDSGKLRGDSRFLASRLFPYDEDAKSKITSWVRELVTLGSIIPYRVDDDEYIMIPGWLKHQKIDHPVKSKLPDFDMTRDGFARIREEYREDQGLDQGLDQGREQGVPPSPPRGNETLISETPEREIQPSSPTQLSGSVELPSPVLFDTPSIPDLTTAARELTVAASGPLTPCPDTPKAATVLEMPFPVKSEKASPNTPEGNPGFMEFWKLYPRRVGRANAFKAWRKIKPDVELVNKILDALDVQRDSEQWAKEGGQFIPHPATWLNREGWLDEPPEKPGPLAGYEMSEERAIELSLIAMRGGMQL